MDLNWQAIRKSLMIRGDGWQEIIEEVPDIISYQEAKKSIQSKESLMASGFWGLGHISGATVRDTLDKNIIEQGIEPHMLNFDMCALQWLHQYYIIEGIIEHWRSKPLGEWPPAHLDFLVSCLHCMVYMAALMSLFEEKTMRPTSVEFLEATEAQVRERVGENNNILYLKARAYGESWRRHGLPGLVPRLWDKIARIAQLQADKEPANFEKLEDSVRDLLGYSTIALSLILEIPEDIRSFT